MNNISKTTKNSSTYENIAENMIRHSIKMFFTGKEMHHQNRFHRKFDRT